MDRDELIIGKTVMRDKPSKAEVLRESLSWMLLQNEIDQRCTCELLGSFYSGNEYT